MAIIGNIYIYTPYFQTNPFMIFLHAVRKKTGFWPIDGVQESRAPDEQWAAKAQIVRPGEVMIAFRVAMKIHPKSFPSTMKSGLV